MGKHGKNKYLLKLESEMSSAGLDPKKEIGVMVVTDCALLGLGIYLYFVEKQLLPALGTALLSAFANYFFLSKAKRLSKEKNGILESEFVRLFSYCSIYLRDGLPVYHSLEEVIRYAGDEMQGRLRTLLKEIDADKSVAPYIRFASGFSSLEIRQVMISLYKIADDGGGEAYLRQFSLLFESLANGKWREQLSKSEDTFNNLCMLPLIDSAMSMILITVGIVVVIGGLINGI